MRAITFTSILILTLYSSLSYTQERNVGITACDSLDCQQQFKEFRKLARNGSPRAQLTLAGMYYAGYGIERDVQKSLSWYRRAAKYGGVAFGTYRAGMIYLFDKEIEQNVEKGVEFLQRAAKADHAHAASVLSDLYLYGTFVEKDMKEGVKWLKIAANLRHKDSIYDLARLYEEGTHVEKNEQTAIELYKKVAKRLPEARDRLLALGAIDEKDDIFASTRGNGIEKVVVFAPDLPRMFDIQLEGIKSTNKYNNPKTCSRISSSPCGNQVLQIVLADDIQHVFDGVFINHMRDIKAMVGH